MRERQTRPAWPHLSILRGRRILTLDVPLLFADHFTRLCPCPRPFTGRGDEAVKSPHKDQKVSIHFSSLKNNLLHSVLTIPHHRRLPAHNVCELPPLSSRTQTSLWTSFFVVSTRLDLGDWRQTPTGAATTFRTGLSINLVTVSGDREHELDAL